MQSFLEAGLSWVIRTSHIEFIRPLQLNDHFSVTTNISSFYSRGVNIEFKINRKQNDKLCSKGYLDCSLIDIKSGRSKTIPNKESSHREELQYEIIFEIRDTQLKKWPF